MQSDWQTFLGAQAASYTDGIVSDFGDAAAELSATARSTVLCDLTQFGTLRVSGEDAQSFLQNLLSNDIREVNAAQSQYSSFNTAKGRMLATMLVYRQGSDYLLQLPASLTELMRKKLSMYVLRAKAKITNISNELILLGLSGSGAERALSLAGLAIPELAMGTTQNPAGSVIRIDQTRFEISAPPEQATSLWQTFGQLATPAGSPCWDWLNIRAGLPVILPQTQEQFVAQMANLDLTGGLNFKKGCYPGQEIVARMHYLGKLKRRMYLAHLDKPAAPGDELYSTAAQSCGMIVNATPSPAGGYDVLAVIQTEIRDTQTVHLGSTDGAQLKFEALPYPLP